MVDSTINIFGFLIGATFVYLQNHFFLLTEKRFYFILIHTKTTCTVNDAQHYIA